LQASRLGYRLGVRRPLEGSYSTTFAIVMIALCPNIIVTTAWTLVTKPVGHSLALGPTGLEVTEGLSNAGYALGALIGGDLTQRFRQRPLHLGFQTLFCLACVLSAVATSWPLFAVGRVLQGLATGFLLVIAIPPLVQRFPARRLPLTAAGINVAFFGAVCAGPLIGGVSSLTLHDYRYLFVGLAVVAAAGVGLGLVSLPDQEPPNPDLRPDWPAFGLATVATIAPFLGVSLLISPTRGYNAPAFWAPLAAGVIALAALFVVEYRRDDALTPVRQLASALPLIGILVATFAGAVFVTAVQLLIAYVTGVQHSSALYAGVSTWPQIVTLFAAAIAFYFLLRTRFLGPFVLVGFAVLAGGVALLLQLGHAGTHGIVLASTALFGFGAGATVSPALWLAGLSVSAKLVGRVFALVELIRAEGDYIIAPVIRKISVTSAGSRGAAHGIRHGVWITIVLTLGSIVVCVAIWLLGRVRLQQPDLERYVDEGEPAIESPPLLAA
jgi:MFS family permease